MTEPKRPSAANNAPIEARIIVTLPPPRMSMSLDAAEAHARAILAAVARARSGEPLPGDQIEIVGDEAP